MNSRSGEKWEMKSDRTKDLESERGIYHRVYLPFGYVLVLGDESNGSHVCVRAAMESLYYLRNPDPKLSHDTNSGLPFNTFETIQACSPPVHDP